MNSKRKEGKAGLIVVLILTAAVVAAVVIGVSQAISAAQNTRETRFVEVPLVETRVLSHGGTSHAFGARVSLEVARGANTPDGAALQSAVLDAISTLSYDDITSFDGMNLLRQAVLDKLSDSFNDGDLVAVYFTELLSDMPMPSRQENRLPGRNVIFDAIFGN